MSMNKFARGRAAWLELVYGKDVQWASYCHNRRLSAAKIAFVDRLLMECMRTLPWLNSRILHCYAFRPTLFDNTDGSDYAEGWGPMYSTVSRPKGRGGKRVLDIPNYPLKIVQKAILDLYLNKFQENLPQCVHGFRRGVEHTIFTNAGMHIDPAAVVKIDLVDFFPSIRTGDVISFLSNRAPSICLPSPVEGEMDIEHKWLMEVAVLFARLTTWKGRLPQGAPTSPALANLVFAPYDDQIQKWASENNLVYSRYADDLTFSVPSKPFRSRFEEKKRLLKERALECVSGVLQKSPFRIHHRKTRITLTSGGHEVTGLHVNASVSIPGRVRRRIRAALCNAERMGLVEAANCANNGQNGSRHITPKGVVGDRKPIAQGMLLIIRDFLPELHIYHQRDEGSNIDRRHFLNSNEGVELTGPDRKFFLEQLTLNVAQEKVRFRQLEGALDVLNPDDSPAYRLVSKGPLAVLLLSGDKLENVVSFYQSLRGFVSFLGGAPVHDAAFAPINVYQEEVRSRLKGITLFGTSPAEADVTPRARVTGDRPDLSLEDAAERFWRLADQLPELWEGQLPDRRVFLRRPAHTAESYGQFLEGLYSVVVESTAFELKPSDPKYDKILSADTSFYRLIELLRDIAGGQRSRGYLLVHHFHNVVTHGKGPNEASGFYAVRLELIRLIADSLEILIPEKRYVEPGWTPELPRNSYRISRETRFYNALIVIEKTQKRLSCESPAFFAPDASDELNKILGKLQWNSRQPVDWSDLYEFGLHIHKAMFEQARGDYSPTWLSSKLEKFIDLLRNAHAHTNTRPSKQKEIRWLSREVCEILGLPEDDSSPPISNLEVQEVKLYLVEGYAEVLKKVEGADEATIAELVESHQERKRERKRNALFECPQCEEKIDLMSVPCSECKQIGVRRNRSEKFVCTENEHLSVVKCPGCEISLHK